MINIVILVVVCILLYIPIHIFRGLPNKTKLIRILFYLYLVLASSYIGTCTYLIYKIHEQEKVIRELLTPSYYAL